MQKNKRNAIWWIGKMVVVLCSLVFVVALYQEVIAPRLAQGAASEINPVDFYSRLGPGWNLGNALDAYEDGFYSNDISHYETLWGNPSASKQLFEEVSRQGFRSVRIPVTWAPHMDTRGIIDPAWLARLRELVDYALESNLYVIINAHHDSWYQLNPDNLNRSKVMLANLWGQVAEYFSEYDERLLFEAMNEPRLVGHEAEWTCGDAAARECVNILNQLFVNTVRNSDGMNTQRYLLVPTYSASFHADALADFDCPEDDRTAVSLHLYQPFSFTHEADTAKSWYRNAPQDEYDTTEIIDKVCDIFLQQNIPVVITEFGAIDKENEPARLEWAQHLISYAGSKNIPALWWDNGTTAPNEPRNTFALLNRHTYDWYFPALVEAITA